MSREHDPLDQEERALADALARATPRAGPPPELDAAILASARRALATGTASNAVRPRIRRRWPAVLGVAASLALAVGIAWQLRPAPDTAVPAASEGPPVVFDTPPPASREPMQADPAPAPGTAASPAGEPPVEIPAVREPAPPAPAAARPLPPGREDDGAPSAAPSTPASQPEGRLPIFEPSPPPVDTAIGRKRVRQQAGDHALPARAARAPLPASPVPESAEQASRATAGDIVFDQEGLDDEPPATVDSPQARRAWLDRIRELRDAGELDAARESLGEYRRRYPDLDLPADLEGLLSE